MTGPILSLFSAQNIVANVKRRPWKSHFTGHQMYIFEHTWLHINNIKSVSVTLPNVSSQWMRKTSPWAFFKKMTPQPYTKNSIRRAKGSSEEAVMHSLMLLLRWPFRLCYRERISRMLQLIKRYLSQIDFLFQDSGISFSEIF